MAGLSHAQQQQQGARGRANGRSWAVGARRPVGRQRGVGGPGSRRALQVTVALEGEAPKARMQWPRRVSSSQ